jgi:restriction system protein
MAGLTQRRIGELIQAVFQILAPESDGLPVRTVLAEIEKSFPLTEFEKSTYPKRPTIRRFEKVVRFATIMPVKAGWLIKDKGQWTLTDQGHKAWKQFSDPLALKQEVNRLYKQWHSTVRSDDVDALESPTHELEEDIPDDRSVVEEAEETAWTQVREFLQRMNPYDFQNLVAALLRAMGYYVVWVAPPGPDGGIDILAHTDPLGAKGPRIVVQVKHRNNKVTPHELRSFLATLGDGDVGLFVSMVGFTSTTEQESRGQERRRIMLINLEKLFDLWVQHYQSVSEADRSLLPLKPVYYLAPFGS